MEKEDSKSLKYNEVIHTQHVTKYLSKEALLIIIQYKQTLHGSK